MLNIMVLGGEVLGRGGGDLLNGISALTKETSEISLDPSTM